MSVRCPPGGYTFNPTLQNCWKCPENYPNLIVTGGYLNSDGTWHTIEKCVNMLTHDPNGVEPTFVPAIFDSCAPPATLETVMFSSGASLVLNFFKYGFQNQTAFVYGKATLSTVIADTTGRFLYPMFGDKLGDKTKGDYNVSAISGALNVFIQSVIMNQGGGYTNLENFIIGTISTIGANHMWRIKNPDVSTCPPPEPN